MTTTAPGTIVINGMALTPGSGLFVEEGSLDIQNAIGRESTCDLVVIDTEGAQHFSQGQSLLVYDGDGALVFAGWLTSVKEKLQTWTTSAHPTVRHTVQATDHHYLANKRRVAASYTNQTAGAIVLDIIATVLAAEGVYGIKNLLSANQSDIEADTTGFLTSAATATRDTTRFWHGAASLKLDADGTTNDSYAAVGPDLGHGFTLGMVAGQTYTASAYLYVPSTTGLTPDFATRGERIVAFYKDAGGVYHDLASNAPTATDTWQRVSVTFSIPSDATEAFVRIYNGFATSGHPVWFDGLQVEPDATAQGASAWELGGTSTVQDGATVTAATFSYASAAECLDALAQRAGFWWMIDAERRLHFLPRETYTAPWTFDGSQDDAPGGSVEVERTNPEYRNRQYVGGGIAETDTQVEVRIGDGNTRAWTLGYPLARVPTVEVQLAENPGVWVAKTVGIAQVDTGKDFYWNAGKNTIIQDSAGAVLRGPTGTIDKLRVTYIGQFDFIALSFDDAQVSTQKSVEGGTTSGYVEAIYTDSSLQSADVAFEVANSYLARYATSGTVLTFTTRQSGLAPGQLLTVDLPVHDLHNEAMLIESVSISDALPDALVYHIKAIAGPVDTTWVEFFKVLTASGLKNQNPINVGSGQTVITLVPFSGNMTLSGTLTATVYACPLFPSTFPLSLC